MEYQQITYSQEDGVAILALNLPDKLNALTGTMLSEMAEAIKDADNDDAVKVLIITGAGRGFCSGGALTGGDSGLDHFHEAIKKRSTILDPFARFGTVMRCLRNIDKPVLGAINGVAAGAGLSLALTCDLRIASDKARFSSIFVNVACNPDTGTSYYLPRVVGVAKALEMIWTGDFVDAEEALRIGLVNRVVPHDDLMSATRELAVRLACGPSLAHEFAKRLVYHGLEANSYEAQLAYEAYALSVCFQSADVKEGGRAFREKRKPEFKGR